MKMFVGVTNSDWYNLLKVTPCDEVNFWTPGANTGFRVLQPNELFLFKLHHPQNFIVGGGYFVRYSALPTYLAWDAFGIKNGCRSIDELNQRIGMLRDRNNIQQDPQIGCIILTEPFFFDESDWIPIPEDFKRNIVRGKAYDTAEITGRRLFEQVLERLQRQSVPAMAETGARYSESLTQHRLGQGAFRISVTEAYQKRCAVSGEKTLPVLEAAHIKPYADNGPHALTNGILLRSDIHTLFDKGYVTITPDYHVEVSQRLHSDFGNGKDYYKHHGSKLLVLPEQVKDLPSPELLQWHNENVYYG